MSKRETAKGLPPTLPESSGAPRPINPDTGQHEDYWVLSAEDRSDGLVRPVRRTYIHNKCGTATTMGEAIAQTYAKDPSYYGSTFCCACKQHFPVSGFQWEDGSVVGS